MQLFFGLLYYVLVIGTIISFLSGMFRVLVLTEREFSPKSRDFFLVSCAMGILALIIK